MIVNQTTMTYQKLAMAAAQVNAGIAAAAS